MANSNPENDQARRLLEQLKPKQANPPDPRGSLRDRMAQDGRANPGQWSDRKSGVVDPASLPKPRGL